MTNGPQLQVASTFSCTPLGPALSRVLDREVAFVQFGQMSEYLLGLPPAPPPTLVLLRLEDWLRDRPPSNARQELKAGVEEFVHQIAILSRLGPPVWFAACPSNGWISETHNVGGLCRTFTNLAI